MLTLPKTREKEFSTLLRDWHKKWKDFINEKTRIVGTKHRYYTHKSDGYFASVKKKVPASRLAQRQKIQSDLRVIEKELI